MNKIIKSAMGAGAGLLLLAGSAFAATDYSFFGEADYTAPGNASSRAVETVSDTDPGFGGINFDVPSGTTFATLTTLSTDYNVTDDNCSAGSPRFQIKVQTPSNGVQNIFVYIGPEPSYTGCVPNVWTTTGDLLETPHFVDTTQLGGTFYDPYANAVATYGSYPVLSVQLVTDGGWNAVASGGDSEQTVLFDNTNINGTVYTFEPNVPTNKEQCKKDGWQSLEDSNGQPFKNQGQCVSYFNHQ